MLDDPLLVLDSDEGGALPVPLGDAHAGDLLHVLQGHPVIISIWPHLVKSLKYLLRLID